MSDSKSKTRVVVVFAAAAGVLALVIFGIATLFFGDDDAVSGTPSATSQTAGAGETTPSIAPEKTEKPKKLKPEATLTEAREITHGGDVRITSIESVTSQARIPGEIVGPAIRVTMQIDAGTKPVDLSRVVVNAYFGKKKTPAIEALGPGVKLFSGELQPGKSTSGVFVFNVPKPERDAVTIEFIHGGSLKPLIFQGSVS